MAEQLISRGGSFAPPLTDELIDKYEQLGQTAVGSVADALRSLLKVVKMWWELEESKQPGSPHPVDAEAIANGRRPLFGAMMIPLEKEHQKHLWDDIPWDDELDLFAQRFENVQLEETKRNEQRLMDWYRQIEDAILPEMFPGETRESLTQVVNPVVKKLLSLSLEYFGVEATKVLDNLINAVAPGWSAQAAQERIARYNEWKIRAVQLAKNHANVPAPVPKPELEDTSLRDACFHLLWHAKELARDREPITRDKLSI